MDWLFPQNQILRIKEEKLKIAFFVSLVIHGFFLFMSFETAKKDIIKPELTVQIEIEKLVLIPKIEELAEVKKLAEIEKVIKEIEVKEEIKKAEEIVKEISPEEIEDVVVEKREVIQKIIPEENIIIENPDEQAMLRYQDMIKRKIQELRRYPRWAKKQGFQGVSVMAFVLNFNGVAQDVRLISSSGFSILDKEAIATVRRASPFPPIPSNITQESITMEVGLNFQLEQ